jgi:flagellar protein FlgJ
MSPADERRFEGLLNRGRMPASPEDAPEFLRYLCRQIEAQVAGTVLKSARRTYPAGGFMSGGFAGSMYQGMADEEYARLLASSGGFGLGDALYTQLFAGRAYAAGAARNSADGSSRSRRRVR